MGEFEKTVVWTLRPPCSTLGIMNQRAIEQQLTHVFKPTHLKVVDDSQAHQGHRGTTAKENTHFHVIVVSALFDGKSLIERHRHVNQALKNAFNGPLHALKITAKTPAEWINQ